MITDTGEQSVQPEPRAVRLLKSMLVGRGPVNRVIIRLTHARIDARFSTMADARHCARSGFGPGSERCGSQTHLPVHSMLGIASDRTHNMPRVRPEPDTMNPEPSDRFGLPQDRCVLAHTRTARERITNAIGIGARLPGTPPTPPSMRDRTRRLSTSFKSARRRDDADRSSNK